jgi:hypothetical protein
MARRYVRDARGRFAGKGFSGQTGGRGARLKSGKGNTRDTGGARTTKGTGKPKGTISKTKFGRDDDRTNRQLDRDIAAAKGRVAARKKKTKSEGQQYADTQAKAKAARKAETTKRLEAFNKKTQARLDTQTKPPSGREVMKASVRKVQNQKVRNLNKQIKEAGPNAAGLRLEKLKVQSRMSATRATPTAKQTAKSAQQNNAIRARSAELRRQAGRVNRAYANQERTADTRNKPGSSMIRRPSRKTTRGAIRAEQALKFYRDPKRALNSVNKKRPGFRMPRGMRK